MSVEDKLGEVIWRASHADEATVSVAGAKAIAKAVLANGPWTPVVFGEPPLDGLTYESIERMGEYDDDQERAVVEKPAEATVISSDVRKDTHHAKFNAMHKIVLDVDLPVKAIPSSTEGHFHLYIDKEVRWVDYIELLNLLARIGVIEKNYASVSIARGYTSARLPWVKKETSSD